MNTIIINDERKGMTINHVSSKIDTDLLDLIADSIVLNGSIEGIVEGEKISQQHSVTYKNGTRVRFRVGTFMKGR